MKNRIQFCQSEIHRMAVPILINYLVTISFETVDKAFISRYSAEGFAAVGISGGFLYSITGALGILCSAYGILAAKAKGREDSERYRKLFQLAMSLAVVIGLSFVVLAQTTGGLFLEVVYGIQGQLLQDALSYYQIASWTVLLNLVLFQFNVFFRNEKHTEVTLVSNVAASVTNLVLDYLLIYGRGGFRSYGVKGAAMASVAGLWVGIVISLIEYYRLRSRCDKKKMSAEQSGWKCMFTDMIKLYLPLLLQDFTEYTLFSTIMMAMISRLGTYEIAAYHILTTITGYIILPAYAYGTVAMTLSVQLKEQGKLQDAALVVRKSLRTTRVVIMALCICVGFLRTEITGIFTEETEVSICTLQYLWIPLVTQLIYSEIQIYKYLLQGWGQEKYVFYSNVIWCVMASVISYCFIELLGLNAVFVGIVVGYIGNLFVLKARYQRARSCS